MKKWKFKTAGIPDDFFIRGDIPMTKEEIRAVVIAKLRLKNKHIIYDIGAGTGSISIELAIQAREGKVFSVERNDEGVELIKKNIEHFALNNIKVISGKAPESLMGLPSPDRVVIGGSGGHLKEILTLLDNKLKKDGRIVITAVTINTLHLAITCLEKLNYKLDISNIAVSRTRSIANYHMFKALNPIYVISAKKGE